MGCLHHRPSGHVQYASGDSYSLSQFLNIHPEPFGYHDHRWRIEHAQMVCDEDIPRFAKAGIIPSMQPSHCTSDMPWLHDRLGSERLHRISRWKSFINAGCQIPGGSDCPIEEGNPIFEFYAAVTRHEKNT